MSSACIDSSPGDESTGSDEGHSMTAAAPAGSNDDGQFQALLLHKRPDQSGHELIQQLLNASSDIGIFSTMVSDSMEKVIKIDRDVNQRNCAEVMTGDATRILRA